MKAKNRTALKVLAAVVSVGVGLLLVEVATRLFLPFNTPETLREHSLEYEASSFGRFRLAPVDRLVEVDEDKAWGAKPADAPSDRTYFINDLGFRGPRFAPRKTPGTTRVFVMGGSSVFDQNVYDESEDVGHSWPNRAEALLRSRGHSDIEVINGGVPGHASIDVIARLYSEIWLYEPDVVVLYNAWNDIRSFHAAVISPEHPPATQMRPWDRTADPFRNYQNPIDRLLSYSQVYVKLRNRYYSESSSVGLEGRLPEGSVSSRYAEFGPAQYELNVRTFVDVVRHMGARPLLATQATLIAPGITDSDKERIGYRYQLLDFGALQRAFDETYGIVRSAAADEDIPLLDAALEMNGRSEFFADHVHLTPAGSETLATLLADLLDETLDPSTEGAASSGAGG